MAQEDKELLLKDLCARLPYGVIAKYKSREKEGEVKITYGNIRYVTELGNGWWKECKPYLRPMSSMTKKEKKEIDALFSPIGQELFSLPYVDWLNAHHFDYRGLIEKGLALEAPKDMYNLKEK